MKNFILLTLISLLFENLALADLVPATSEDLNDFDQQIKASQGLDSGPQGSSARSGAPVGKSLDNQKAKKNNFGAAVSAEAKGLRDLPAESRPGFGKWVSEQRKQNDQNQAGAGSSNGAGNAGGASANDARNSSPAHKDSGNSPGNSGNNKKK